MRFRPSAYSDVAAVVPPDAAPAPSAGQQAAATGIAAAGKLLDIGLDSLRASSDAKMHRWDNLTKKKKKKKAAPAFVPSQPPPPPPSPFAMTPLVKWSLIGMGVLAAGLLGYVVFVKNKPEEEPPRRNAGKRTATRASAAPRRSPSIKSARTEIAATSKASSAAQSAESSGDSGSSGGSGDSYEREPEEPDYAPDDDGSEGADDDYGDYEGDE